MTARRISEQLNNDEARFDLMDKLARREERQEAKEQGEAPPPEPTPHARGLPARRLLITFPDPAWPDAVKEFAEQHGCRHSDVVIKALSEYLYRVARGEAEPPERVPDHRMRAGEAEDLPWRPA